MDFIHSRELMSEVVALTNFTRELEFMATFTGAPLILRVGLGYLRILVLLFISLIIIFTTILFVVIRLSGLHCYNIS